MFGRDPLGGPQGISDSITNGIAGLEVEVEDAKLEDAFTNIEGVIAA